MTRWISLRIKPELPVRVVEIGIADNIRADRAVREAQVTCALRDREWETRGECRDAIQLPSTNDGADKTLLVRPGSSQTKFATVR